MEPTPERPDRRRQRWPLVAIASAFVAVGGAAIAVAVASQHHAPQPPPSAAGTVGPPGRHPSHAEATPPAGASPTSSYHQGVARSDPVTIRIPAIAVDSKIQYVGQNPNGTIQVPPLGNSPLTNEAAWYKYSPTPGQVGPSIIEGHIDSAAQGPSVFFRLGALTPGDKIYVTLADHTVATFSVTGVRSYHKSAFPTTTIYADTSYPALRLLTCGGRFDYQTHHYLSNIVVFARLVTSKS